MFFSCYTPENQKLLGIFLTLNSISSTQLLNLRVLPSDENLLVLF